MVQFLAMQVVMLESIQMGNQIVTRVIHAFRACKPFLDERAGPPADPFGKAGTDRLCPAPLLTAREWQRLVAGTGNQIRCEAADVVGQMSMSSENRRIARHTLDKEVPPLNTN